jgi:hypothetical protein
MENSNYVVTNEPTKINVTLGLDLGVIDSAKNGETVDQAFERVYKFVEDKLTEKIKEAQEEAAEA